MNMRLNAHAALLAVLALASTGGTARGQAIQIDPKIQPYEKTSGISGNLNSVGSDTLNNLMTLWAEGFRREYPNVKAQIEGKGSSTAPPALIAGTAQIGPMSRAMKSSETDAFEAKFGHKPTQIAVALDGLAVYVHKDNPLESITLTQLDAVFSKTRQSGAPKDIRTWGDLGLTGAWASRPISIYGRNSASGTYGYFKEHALFGGDYKDTVKEQPGSASVVQGVTEDLNGIGYSGIGYRTSGVKALKVAKAEGDTAYGVSYDEVVSGEYPLARFLYLYVNKTPNKPIDPLVGEFVKYVLSREGQQIVVKDGYLPLPDAVLEKERAKLQ